MATTTSHIRRNERNRPIFLQNLIIIRLINAWWINTFFQPDEFFQSLEPAWRLAFGPSSGAWLTWEWHHHLRSSLHPIIFSAGYIAADLLSKLLPAGHMLRASIVVGSPKVLQAVCAGLCDWYTWQLAVKIFGPDSNTSFFALFLQLFNPWQWYCSTRTFSNSLETTLTVMALYYWPWRVFGTATPTKENPRPANVLGGIWRLRASLCLAALAVVLRPTNILIWATIAGMALTRVSLKGASPVTWSMVLVLAREAVLCGALILGISAASDYFYFGVWTFPPYNWLNFNISKSLAVFYGRNPWHYYLSQGLPLLCTTSLPFALWGLYKPGAASTNEANALRTISYAVFTTVAALSSISHKEVRFIYPLLPILSILAAPHAATFFTSPSQSSSKTALSRPRIRNKPWLFSALGVNLLLAGYLSFLHQPAPLTVLSYLRKEYERIHPASVELAHRTDQVAPVPGDEMFALFLMPCHTTPWRSHLYYPGLQAYALSCEPPLHTQPNTLERETYRDEADRFYDDPVAFLRTELFAPHRNMLTPRYIVGFEGIEPWLLEFLETTEGKALDIKPRRVWGGFNGLFNEDWRRAGRMIVWDTGVYSDAPPEKKKKKAQGESVYNKH
ncbi:glycosylphosphatidylinositol anchor biosynthesis [Conoideocrella luteorostrata]|uniref:Mannosyltransferase n=1 Tax=Conoideocrella luteorostrata TaxID=1105319 RepID=A0AAJ0CT28_9HYPO|nr:glycosylphosphatidylinositol anchor biosynthesis [Conoideocrella luteorostrata]